MLYLDLTLRDLQCGCAQPYIIGRRGTSGVLTVRLDYSDWVRAYGGGAITLMVKPYGAGAAYPVTLDDDHGLAAWPVSNSDTQTAGVGQAEFVFHPDASTVDKSAVFSFFVLPDIGPAMSEPPDAYEDWVSRLEQLGSETLQHARDAAASATEAGNAEAAAEEAVSRYPQIIDSYWYVWDPVSRQYVNTGVKAEGSGGDGALPPGGTDGQYLVKDSAAEGGAKWAELPAYGGVWSVTPLVSTQTTLETAQTYLDRDIVVEAIPYAEVSNISGGMTATIGG